MNAWVVLHGVKHGSRSRIRLAKVEHWGLGELSDAIDFIGLGDRAWKGREAPYGIRLSDDEES